MTERELFERWKNSNPLGYKTSDQYAKAAFLEGMRLQKIRCIEEHNRALKVAEKKTDWAAA